MWSFERKKSKINCKITAFDLNNIIFSWQENKFNFCKPGDQVDIHIKKDALVSVHTGYMPRLKLLQYFLTKSVCELIMEYTNIVKFKKKNDVYMARKINHIFV